MSTRYRCLVGVVLLVTTMLASLSTSPARAAAGDLRMPEYFPETGFWVQGPFREYWETRGGLFVFGYPITGVFFDDGYYKQYFERAIFEYHPENAGTQYEVLLQRLGAIRTAHRLDEPAFQPVGGGSDPNCTFYDETDHWLCWGFKGYWEKYGGLMNFGYPLSEEFAEQNDPPPSGDGQIHTVQYYERARFEYHPENKGTPYEVLLGLLGSEYLVRNGAPPEALQRQPADLPPYDPTTNLHLGPHVGYGFNIAWLGESDGADAFHQRVFDKVNEAGFSWVRIQVGWRDAEPQPGTYHFGHIERIVSLARQNNVRVLASVAKAPDWATGGGHGIPTETGAFQAFMQRLSGQFKGRIDAYEIWNEQNLAAETGGSVDIARYVNLLRAGHAGIETSDPTAIVVFGGLSPTGVNNPSVAIDDVEYLRQVYAYNGGEVKRYYDVLGAHPGSNNNSPDQWWPGNPGSTGWSDHNSFYFRRVAELRDVMVANGEGHKQVWLTEFGWTTANPAPGYEYGAEISEHEQAEYLVRSFQIARSEWPWMGVMFVWNLNFSTVVGPEDEKGPWSVLRPDWSNRPSFDALKQMSK